MESGDPCAIADRRRLEKPERSKSELAAACSSEKATVSATSRRPGALLTGTMRNSLYIMRWRKVTLPSV